MQSASPTTYHALKAKIKAQSNAEELRKFENTLTRHYQNNTITTREFSRLDVLLMEEIARHDN